MSGGLSREGRGLEAEAWPSGGRQSDGAMRRRGGAEAAGRGDGDGSGKAAEQSAERPRR